MKKNDLSLEKYIDNLTKKDLCIILDSFDIAYKNNANIASLKNLILDNLNKIVSKCISLFQEDEYLCVKYFIRCKGKCNVKVNNLLILFLENMVCKKIIIKDGNNYIMPIELVSVFSKKLNNKSTKEIILKNTIEYNYLLGLLDVYGIMDIDFLYQKYIERYELSKEDFLVRINELCIFYNEFNIYKDGKKEYVTSKAINSMITLRKFNKNIEYMDYSFEDIRDIHTFEYFKRFKSYKKFKHFILRNFNIKKGSIKIINKSVLRPYLTINQIDKVKAKKELNKLIDKYFECKNEKTREKFIELVKNISLDYPKWKLKGQIERKRKNVKD